MTIDELGTQMKQIDPNLELYFYKDYKVPDHISYEEDGVEHVLYEFLKNEFDKYECSKTISPFQFIKLQNLISYFFDDTYSQTISKERNGSIMQFEDDISKDSQTISKERNGSIMQFEDDISKDSQKKPVLSGLYTKKEVDSILKGQPKMKSKEQVKRNFIDYLLDQGIGYKVHTSHGIIEQIGIENEAYDTICSINFFNDKGNQVGLYKVGRVDKKQLETILGLYEQILEMMEELMRLKEDGDGK